MSSEKVWDDTRQCGFTCASEQPLTRR